MTFLVAFIITCWLFSLIVAPIIYMVATRNAEELPDDHEW